MADETTPEDVADVLWLGVLEQGIARLPALCEAVARAVPAGADPVAEDDVLGESIAAGFAVALRHLEKRLSPEDLHRLHLAIESRAGRMDPNLAHHVWRYYYALGGESGEAMLRALGREFRAKC